MSIIENFDSIVIGISSITGLLGMWWAWMLYDEEKYEATINMAKESDNQK